MQETSMIATMDLNNVRKLDIASPALPNRYASPKITLNIGVGVIGGLILGLGFAFFVAFIDDRVKSSFDIESVVGLPLLGIIPQIKKMEQPDKAQRSFSRLRPSQAKASPSRQQTSHWFTQRTVTAFALSIATSASQTSISHSAEKILEA
jgi:hypothetical protein